MWILFISVFSIIFITSLGDCTRPQHEEIPIFAGLASKFENVGPIFSSSILAYPCHPLQEMIGNSFNV